VLYKKKIIFEFQALEFLHEVGLACHNNVSQQAILVTPEGRWKLGGMEFVTK